MKIRTAVCVLALGLFAGVAQAHEEIVIPASVQLELFTKIWSLDRSFPKSEPIRLAILYQRLYRESFVVKEEMVRAGALAKIEIVLIDLDAAKNDPGRFDRIDVAYVAPLRAVDISALLAELRVHRIRTITAVPEYVTSGVAVGIAVEADRPVILINLASAHSEGSDFSSQLLKLARVIR